MAGSMKDLPPAARQSAAGLIFPRANVAEAAIVDDLPLFPVQSLMDATRLLVSPAPAPEPPPLAETARTAAAPTDDLADVRGQLAGPDHALQRARAFRFALGRFVVAI